MRILMLAQFYPPIIGGEERHVRNLGAALVQRGHAVSVATLRHTGMEDVSDDQGVRVHRLKGTVQRASGLFSDSDRTHAPPFPDPEVMAGLRRVIADEQPDVVHAHNWMLHSFLPLRRWSGARMVLTLHDYSLACAKKTLMRDDQQCPGPAFSRCLGCASDHYGVVKGAVTTLGNWSASRFEERGVDKFLTVSRAVADGNGLARRGVSFEVVPNFIPDNIGQLEESCDPRLAELPDEPFLLFVGDLRRLKGLDVLLAAYTRLRHGPPLVLIGRRCPDTPATLPPNVRLLESWPHAMVMQAWKRALVGIAPSIWPEPCATVVMEAMALGKAVVATDIGGMPDMVDDGETGFLVPPGDAEALAVALQRLIDDPSLRERMERASLRRVGQFQAASVVPRIEASYRAPVARVLQ